MYLEKNVTFC